MARNESNRKPNIKNLRSHALNSTKKKQQLNLQTVTLENGEKVQLVGFGTFETRERAAREGRNPRTKEVIKIAASTVPVFKAGKEFKEKVNK